MGKGSVSEHLPSYGGVYGGESSYPEVKKFVESSDCILWLGNYPVSWEESADNDVKSI